ncbi:MAG: hypothetical protein SV966_01915 [Actinomycetota bacterium]|nr:hypothetical protein [Actinomycetota bacterium]
MSAARNHPAPVGYVIECRGAWLRAQIRGVASVVTVTGRLDQTNVELMIGHLCRFTTLDSPVIIDVKHVDIDDNSNALEHLVSAFAAQCRHRGIDWALVAEPPSHRCALPADDRDLLYVDSVADALHHFVRVIRARRGMPIREGRGRSRRSVAAPAHPTGDRAGAEEHE